MLCITWWVFQGTLLLGCSCPDHIQALYSKAVGWKQTGKQGIRIIQWLPTFLHGSWIEGSHRPFWYWNTVFLFGKFIFWYWCSSFTPSHQRPDGHPGPLWWAQRWAGNHWACQTRIQVEVWWDLWITALFLRDAWPFMQSLLNCFIDSSTSKMY